MQEKCEEISFLLTKWKAEIWKCHFFVVSLHRIWKQELKPIVNYESTMDEFGR
jgi:hypothetical protein